MLKKRISDYLYLGLPNAVTTEGMTRQELESEIAYIHSRKKTIRDQNAIYIDEFAKLTEVENILIAGLDSASDGLENI